MPHRTRPRRGSMQYWPRKRARRIYPRTSWWPAGQGISGFAGFKAGMTHIHVIEANQKSPNFGKPVVRAVTVLDAPPLFVCGLRYYEKSSAGLKCVGEKWSDKIPKEIALKKKMGHSKVPHSSKAVSSIVHLIVASQPHKSGMAKTKPDVFEIGFAGDAEALRGKEIHALDAFKAGECVVVSGVTKGHGFTGPVKRFGIRIQGRKDKQMHRHVGSIGSTTPRKVDWRVPAAGQYGFFTRTEIGKRIILIDDDPKKINPSGGFINYGNVAGAYVLIEGSIPGTTKRLIRIRKAAHPVNATPADVKFVSLQSKQGR